MYAWHTTSLPLAFSHLTSASQSVPHGHALNLVPEGKNCCSIHLIESVRDWCQNFNSVVLHKPCTLTRNATWVSLWHSPHFFPAHVPYTSHFYLLSSHNVSQPITSARTKWYLKARITNASIVLESSQDKSQISNNVRLGYFTRALIQINYSLSNSKLTGPLHSLFLFFFHAHIHYSFITHLTTFIPFLFHWHSHLFPSSTLTYRLIPLSIHLCTLSPLFLHTHRLACHTHPFFGFCSTHPLLFPR